jgi:MFS family permease
MWSFVLVGVFAAVAPLAPAGSVAVAFVLVAVSRFGSGAAAPVGRVVATALRQRMAPDEQRGRVEAGFLAATYGGRPAGFLAAAGLTDLLGIRSTLWVAVLGYAAVTAIWAPAVFRPLPTALTKTEVI